MSDETRQTQVRWIIEDLRDMICCGECVYRAGPESMRVDGGSGPWASRSCPVHGREEIGFAEWVTMNHMQLAFDAMEEARWCDGEPEDQAPLTKDMLERATSGWCDCGNAIDLSMRPAMYACGCGRIYKRQGDEMDCTYEVVDFEDDTPKDTHDRDRQRMMLVDGWPGEWIRERKGHWIMEVYSGRTSVYAVVYRNTLEDLGWMAKIGISGAGVERNTHASLSVLETVEGPHDSMMGAARSIRPHGEALRACLEGMRDE